MDVFQAMQAQMQGMAASDEPPLADVDVSDLTFHPAGRGHLPVPARGFIYRLCRGILHVLEHSNVRTLDGCLEASVTVLVGMVDIFQHACYACLPTSPQTA